MFRVSAAVLGSRHQARTLTVLCSPVHPMTPTPELWAKWGTLGAGTRGHTCTGTRAALAHLGPRHPLTATALVLAAEPGA